MVSCIIVCMYVYDNDAHAPHIVDALHMKYHVVTISASRWQPELLQRAFVHIPDA